MTDVSGLADPRVFPDPGAASPDHARLHSLAAASLEAATRQGSDEADRGIRDELARMLAGDGAALEALFADAPSVAVTRHLWRILDAVWRDGAPEIALALFAIPLVVVTGGARAEAAIHDGVLAHPSRLAEILRTHGALGGSHSFALSAALASVDAIDLARLPDLFAWQRLPEVDGALPPRGLPPSPLRATDGGERAHLRFVVGTMLARSEADPFADTRVGPWGVPFTQELSRQLAAPDVSVLALPRAPQRPLPAVASGRSAQREVGAQLFAANAIRKLRAAAGEPAAVISAHRAPDAPGGGEIRLSLSSPFAPRDAEGFRCPLYPLDRVGDVATMLIDLLADCRVTDVRVAAGVHADRDPATGQTLLFKPDTLPDRAAMH